MFVGSKYIRTKKDGSALGWAFIHVKERALSFTTTRNTQVGYGRKQDITSYHYDLICIVKCDPDSAEETFKIQEDELDDEVMYDFYKLWNNDVAHTLRADLLSEDLKRDLNDLIGKDAEEDPPSNYLTHDGLGGRE
tara:strand:+ start:704 stop:1111 length:408 start_codon:yes stop_codon:yes gene_type:complete